MSTMLVSKCRGGCHVASDRGTDPSRKLFQVCDALPTENARAFTICTPRSKRYVSKMKRWPSGQPIEIWLDRGSTREIVLVDCLYCAATRVPISRDCRHPLDLPRLDPKRDGNPVGCSQRRHQVLSVSSGAMVQLSSGCTMALYTSAA